MRPSGGFFTSLHRNEFFPGRIICRVVHGIRTNVGVTVAGLARLPVMVVMLVLLAVGLEALALSAERSSGFELLALLICCGWHGRQFMWW